MRNGEVWARGPRCARSDSEVFAADAHFYLIEVKLAAKTDAEKWDALQRIDDESVGGCDVCERLANALVEVIDFHIG